MKRREVRERIISDKAIKQMPPAALERPERRPRQTGSEVTPADAKEKSVNAAAAAAVWSEPDGIFTFERRTKTAQETRSSQDMFSLYSRPTWAGVWLNTAACGGEPQDVHMQLLQKPFLKRTESEKKNQSIRTDFLTMTSAETWSPWRLEASLSASDTRSYAQENMDVG